MKYSKTANRNFVIKLISKPRVLNPNIQTLANGNNVYNARKLTAP